MSENLKTKEKLCPNCDRPIFKIESIIHETLPEESNDPNRTYRDSGMRLFYHFDGTICGADENGFSKFVKV